MTSTPQRRSGAPGGQVTAGRAVHDERSWADVGASHPGVRDPRSRRLGEWSPLTDGLIISVAALAVVVATWSAWTASPVGEVRRWLTWQATDIPLSIEYPEGWRVSDFSDAGVRYVMFGRSRWVRVHVVAGPHLAWAAYGRGAAAGRAPSNASYQALALLHESTREVWVELFGMMHEGVAGRTAVDRRRAVWSQFRYSGGGLEDADEPMRGCRVTLIAGGQGVLISAVAPARHWEDFRPIALQMIRSIRVGGGS